MTVKEKILREKENTNKILLYSDGGKFTRAYEQSAFAFSKNIHQFEVLSALNKELNETIIYIGFPTETLESRVKSFKTEVVNDKESIYSIDLDEPIDLEEFQIWKDKMIEEGEIRKKQKEETTKKKEEKQKANKEGKDATTDTMQRVTEEVALIDLEDVIQEILSVNVLKISSIEALSLLSDIQIKLRNVTFNVKTKENKLEKLPFEEA